MNTKLWLIILIIGSTKTLSQPLSLNQTHKEYCSKEKRLSYIDPMDSIRHQVVLDSVNRLLVGRWQLADISVRINKMIPTPEDSIEISVDEQGNSIVYAQGNKIIDFQLAAGIYHSDLRCVISEAGRAYFHLRPSHISDGQKGESKGQAISGNSLRVCEAYLELYVFSRAGPSYVFRRLTPIQSGSKQRN